MVNEGGKVKPAAGIWQVPSSGEVGGSRSGAETRLTGISLRSDPRVGRCNVTSTDLPDSRREVLGWNVSGSIVILATPTRRSATLNAKLRGQTVV